MKYAASFAVLLVLGAGPAQLSQAMADPIVDEKSTTETSITMDEDAYLIHTIIRRHDIASFFDDRSGKGEMKRYLVETEVDRVTREADDEEIDTQSSTLRVKARPLTAAGLGGETMTIETTADEAFVSGPYIVATAGAAAPSR